MFGRCFLVSCGGCTLFAPEFVRLKCVLVALACLLCSYGGLCGVIGSFGRVVMRTGLRITLKEGDCKPAA